MDGLVFVELIEAELERRKIKKKEFYAATGISSATFSQWRKRIFCPSSAAIRSVEKFLGVTFTFEQKNKPAPANWDELDEKRKELIDYIINADTKIVDMMWNIVETIGKGNSKNV